MTANPAHRLSESDETLFYADGDTTLVSVYRSPCMRPDDEHPGYAKVFGFIRKHGLVCVASEERYDRGMLDRRGIQEIWMPPGV